ncbi:prephenate dehydrogenase/arogenate dehydrogenase family protein [Streptomyces sp. NPDC059402]|uniref:prephenate dehydrogenase/arogenate dehydrogenase family protein n=1 Tax=Streptomyces sp. NPDC059402 TaxID=3346822 RepID=UPI0036929EBF
MIGRAVVVGGAGAVGGLFARRLLDAGTEVTVVDPAVGDGTPHTVADTGAGGIPGIPGGPGAAPVRLLRGDITAIDSRLAAELRLADLVVLAVPEPVALAAVRGIAGELTPGALLVDTLSVKQPVTRAVRAHAPEVQAVGLNPMFAPSLGFEGRPVAAVVVTEGPRADELLKLVESWGAVVVRVDAAEHDRLAGATQALTHAAVLGFGLALRDLGTPAADLRPVAPPPANTMLALLARVVSGAPEVYWDVQHANPEAAGARTALAEGLRRLARTVEHGTEDDFAALLSELRDYLGDDLAHHRDTCARLFGRT